MARQTIFLFIRALIIGILLNVSIQQVSDTPSSQHQTGAQDQIHFSLGQPSSSTNMPLQTK